MPQRLLRFGSGTSRGRLLGAVLAVGIAWACSAKMSDSDTPGGGASAGGKQASGGRAAAQGGATNGAAMSGGDRPGTAGTGTDQAGNASGGGGGGACGGEGQPCCEGGLDAQCDEDMVCDPAEGFCEDPTDPCSGSEPTACANMVAGQLSDFGMPWQSSWFMLACRESPAHDCLTVQGACPNQDAATFEETGARTLETFPVGGTPGQNYKVTFTFNAIASAKEYQGGTRDQGTDAPPDVETAVNDGFHRDGSPIPSSYEVWKLMVFDEGGQELRHYYLNSFPKGQGFENHRNFLLGYTKSIVVVGGGSVKYLVQDSNCRTTNNCGPGDNGSACPAPRYLPNEPTDVMLPAKYADASTGQLLPLSQLTPYYAPIQPWHAHLGHLTITAVETTQRPVTHDFL